MFLAKCQLLSAAFYRFAAPRTIFFTLRFFEPRAYSRGFSGFSAFTFLRAVRFTFLRSSLLSFFVFAMSAVYFSLSDSLAVCRALLGWTAGSGCPHVSIAT
jgi:hypothetical protein